MTNNADNINDETLLSKIKTMMMNKWKLRLDQNEGKIRQIMLKTAHTSNFVPRKLNYAEKNISKSLLKMGEVIFGKIRCHLINWSMFYCKIHLEHNLSWRLFYKLQIGKIINYESEISSIANN